MYRCENCNYEFIEPELKETRFEDIYGVSSLFDSTTTMYLSVCPNCGCNDIESLVQCENCGEYTNELFDSKDKFVCEECFNEIEEM